MQLDGIEYNEDFARAFQAVDARVPLIYITGKAGTGKSTLLRLLKKTLNVNMAVVAFTGTAALNVGGSTIHRFFGFPARMLNPEEITSTKKWRLFSELETLIIDEASMVRADLLDCIDASLRVHRWKDRDKPFGGVQIILVRDHFQLPPIVPENVQVNGYPESEVLALRGYRTPFFFHAKCLQGLEMTRIVLDKVYRQSDQTFLRILNNIRKSEELPPTLKELNSLRREPYDWNPFDERIVYLSCYRDRCAIINKRRLDELPGMERILRGRMDWLLPELQDKIMKEDQLPVPMNLVLKPGARIMFTWNMPEYNVVNGTVGTFLDYADGDLIAVRTEDGIEMNIGKCDWTFYDYDLTGDRQVVPKPVGKFFQYPVMLAYALTIHKAQGKTLTRVELDLKNQTKMRGAFAHGQAYVGLSRARELEGLKLYSEITESDVIVEPAVIDFDSAYTQPPVQRRLL